MWVLLGYENQLTIRGTLRVTQLQERHTFWESVKVETVKVNPYLVNILKCPSRRRSKKAQIVYFSAVPFWVCVYINFLRLKEIPRAKIF